jgi:hypothetical protein
VNDRVFGQAAGPVAIALVLVQDAFPAWTGFHTWQYAAVLALLAVAVVQHARHTGGTTGLTGALGALVIVAAGLGSGLLGPDTEIVERPPGTVAPLPDVGAAAFFPNADASAIAAGNSAVVLRRRDGPPLDIGPGDRRFVAATELQLVPRPAAYVEARDAAGNRLTITQPTNPAFLSPVLLFGQRVTIAGTELPADGFAVPAARRQIKAFYFSKSDSQAARARGMAGVESVLFAVDDESGNVIPGAIGFGRSGQTVVLGGVHLRPTLGTYPALAISAVPFPPALFAGGVLLLATVVLNFVGKRPNIVS